VLRGEDTYVEVAMGMMKDGKRAITEQCVTDSDQIYEAWMR
jgi:hypothetical protein